MAYLGRGLDKISNIEVLDNITFDGSSSYSITKGSVAFVGNSAQSFLISIDGIVNAANFTVNGSTIDFGVAVPSTSVCNFFLHYGTGVMTVPSDGSVTTAKLGDNSVSSAKMFSGFANGITEADQFRLTADLSNPGNNAITANLERVDDATFSKMGTGMSESSGVFTFPSTGLYFISMVTLIYVISGDGSAGVDMKISSDSGSSFDPVAHSDGGNGNSSQTFLTVTAETFVNVTNASTFRVKFFASSVTNGQIRGNTDRNDTSFTFIRLGGSQ